MFLSILIGVTFMAKHRENLLTTSLTNHETRKTTFFLSGHINTVKDLLISRSNSLGSTPFYIKIEKDFSTKIDHGTFYIYDVPCRIFQDSNQHISIYPDFPLIKGNYPSRPVLTKGQIFIKANPEDDWTDVSSTCKALKKAYFDRRRKDTYSWQATASSLESLGLSKAEIRKAYRALKLERFKEFNLWYKYFKDQDVSKDAIRAILDSQDFENEVTNSFPDKNFISKSSIAARTAMELYLEK